MNEAISEVPSGGKIAHVVLWAGQILLALAFGMAGVMKSTQPIAELAVAMGWPADVPAVLVRFIGVSELTAALGLVLPAVTRVRTVLTPLAAFGLVLIMILAAGFHVLRAEFAAVPINVVLGATASFVAWGRLKWAPIPSR